MRKYIIAAFIIILLPALAWSQNFEGGIKEVDRDVREKVEKKLEQPPQKPPVITEEKEKVKTGGPALFVKKIELSGVQTFPPEDFDPVLREYENRDVSFAELDELARKIEKEYLRKGVIAACFVPPQDVKDGVVTLVVVEAHMGKLEISDHKHFNKKKLRSYWEIKPGEVLYYYKISRSLQMMNRNPDREAKATLHAGEEPGTTDILLNVETHFPLHPTASFSREGTVATGRETFGYGGRHNNFLGLDDTLMAGYSFTKHSDNLYVYHYLPVTSRGTYALYGFSRSESFPKKDFEQYDLRSYAKNVSFFLHQDVYQKDDYKADVYIGMDGKDKDVYTNDGNLNRDRLRILRVGVRAIYRTTAGVTSVKPEFSQGLNILGARRRDTLSSRNSSNTFSKFNLDITHRYPITPYIQLAAKTSFQLASEMLAPQEEFAMGGINSVRGYAYGDYYADNAVQTNLELLVQPVFLPDKIKLPFDKEALKKEITGVLFFDDVYGVRRGKRDGEKYQDKMASVGAGVRLNLYDQLAIRLEWGFPIPMGDKGITEGARPRLHVTVDFEDKMLDGFTSSLSRLLRN